MPNDGPRSILIVEDEPLIAMMLEDFILSLGHEVSGSCDSVSSALKEIEKSEFDLAILDVNLKGESVWPVASALREKGIPFVLATGGHVDPPPAEFAKRSDDRKALYDRPGHADHRSSPRALRQLAGGTHPVGARQHHRIGTCFGSGAGNCYGPGRHEPFPD